MQIVDRKTIYESLYEGLTPELKKWSAKIYQWTKFIHCISLSDKTKRFLVLKISHQFQRKQSTLRSGVGWKGKGVAAGVIFFSREFQNINNNDNAFFWLIQVIGGFLLVSDVFALQRDYSTELFLQIKALTRNTITLEFLGILFF